MAVEARVGDIAGAISTTEAIGDPYPRTQAHLFTAHIQAKNSTTALAFGSLELAEKGAQDIRGSLARAMTYEWLAHFQTQLARLSQQAGKGK